MRDPRRTQRLSIAWILGIALAILTAGGGAAWWTYHQLTALTSTSLPPTESSQTLHPKPHTPHPFKEERVKIYWLKVTEKQTQLLPSTVAIQPKSARKNEVLEIALQDLLAGPTDSAYTTTIPQGTKLLGATLEKNGVHVNLSQEFTEGGGSEAMIGRLAQILYTATSLAPNSQVWINVEGKPLELLGEGEGVIVDQPMTRQDFEANYQL